MYASYVLTRRTNEMETKCFQITNYFSEQNDFLQKRDKFNKSKNLNR